MVTLSHRFEDAFVYASHIHGAQLRKGTEIPYISHLIAVAALTLEHGGNEDQAIAALLHDAVEDCGGEVQLNIIRQRFGVEVARIVDDCTDSWVEPKPPWKERKEDYIAGIAKKPRPSLLVSLADKTHNARCILLDLRTLGPQLWDRFNAQKEELLWYYQSLADEFAAAIDCPLAAELNRTVQEMRAAG